MTSAGSGLGAFSFVLHSHLPYARRAGRWPHGEEWIHEAASESYLPLIEALLSLPEPREQPYLTVSLTPVLCEQLADADVRRNLAEFMADRRDRAHADIERFTRAGDDARTATARWYARRYADLLALYEQLGCNVLEGFRRLRAMGRAEIATSAATHGYLPLMERDSTIYAQFAVGAQAYARHFGAPPRTAWLPECAYRPAREVERNGQRYTRPGIETFMAEAGLRLFFVETHTVEGGRPAGKAAGDALGPYTEVRTRYEAPPAEELPRRPATTFQPYLVERSPVAVLGRNSATGLQVWSADHGYPGDFLYREFHKKDGVSGLHYWRVTGAHVDLGEKDIWNPEAAFAQTALHVTDFCGLVERELQGYRERAGGPGIVLAAYDTELFGHWWFEGVEWLARVLERLSCEGRVHVTAAGPYVETHPPAEAIALPESSWGQQGNHFTWNNTDVAWMWPIVHAAERRMERLVELQPAADARLEPILAQCAREALLLQASDWPFLVTTGQAAQYAVERFRAHVERFERLAAIAERGDPSDAELALAHEYWEADKLFPDIDYRVFRRREPGA
jgi:1,4-alpha-glucan branching enzyme